jgi:hypothetical protein
MNSKTDEARGSSRDITDYTKCGFMALYCPEKMPGPIDIHELPEHPSIVVTPNPTKGELNISFEITEGVKSVSIVVCDEEGRVLETLLSDRMYMAGSHT